MPDKTTVHRLEDLQVEEVSIVDRPANKRRFLTVKSEGTMPGTEIVIDESGNLVTPAAPAPAEAPPADLLDLAGVFSEFGKNLVSVEKRLALPSDFRTEIFRNLYDGMRRMNAVLQTTEIARADDDGETPLVPLLMGELNEVQKLIGGLVKKLGKTAVSKSYETDPEPLTDPEEVEKADDKLDDGAFLYVKNDGGNKTRLFAVRNAAGALDPAKIRAAISAIGKSKLTDAEKAKALATAKKLLAQAQKERFTAAAKKSEEAPPAPPAPSTDLHALVEAMEQKIEKRGAKMSKERLARFKDAIATLGKLMTELDMTLDDSSKKAETAKVTKAIEDLTSNVTRLADVVKTQAKVIKTLKAATPASNAIPVEKGENDAPRDDSVSWPFDMNDPKTRQTVDKATSFLDS